MKKQITVLSGAGISAESGIKTFRDADGLWEGHDVMKVASPQGWREDREMVLDFYNQRRAQLKEVKPNAGHFGLVKLEEAYDVKIITQNVDDLHERAGSSHIIHLHGELLKSRSSLDENLVYDCRGDILLGDKCERGAQLRPHIVWFGEMVPMLQVAAEITSKSDIVIIIGTSMQVYPAAGLVGYAPAGTPIYYIDPKPASSHELSLANNLTIIAEKGTIGINQVLKDLME